MKNIFLTEGKKGQLISLVYKLLMTREEVTYHDVYLKYMPSLSVDYFEKHSLDKKESSQLKKAFMEVRDALNTKEPGCIANGKRMRYTTYRYVGKHDDPLFEEKQVFVKKTLQDHVLFCKESSGLLPIEWFSHFFDNTQLLLESKRDEEAGNVYIESGVKQVLRGIERLPILYEHIIKRHVLTFTYHPYTKDLEAVIVHPHFLKEYNGRWFLMGWRDDNKDKQIVTNYALDRIETEPQVVESMEYVAAPSGFYKAFFSNMVGVSREKNSEGVQDVVIRSQSRYIHELVKSKKFHQSQIETKPFGIHEDGTYGEFTLYVEWNRELKGKILTFGQELVVISPKSLVDSIRESVSVLWRQYKCNGSVPIEKEP